MEARKTLPNASLNHVARDPLQAAVEQLGRFVEESPVSVAMFDTRMCYMAASRRWVECYGRGYKELVGLCHYDVHPDIPERWKTVHRRALQGEVVVNDADHWVQEDGSDHWLRWAVHPWRHVSGEVGGVIITAEDVTEAVLAEQAARFREQLLREMGHMAKVGGWEFNVATGHGYWTEEIALIHEVDSRFEPSRQIGLEFYVPESRERIERALKQTIEAGIPYDLELEIITAKGNRRWVRTIAHAVWEKGLVTKVRGSMQDITERKLAEDTLRRQASLLDLAYGAVFVWKSGGTITFWSHGAETMYGYSKEYARCRNIHELLQTVSKPGLESVLASLSSEKKWEGELEHTTADGKRMQIASRMVQITQDNSTYVLETVQDITEKNSLEEKLRQSQKMEAIGRLAGGVAHDFNNLLGIILGSAELILGSSDPGRMRARAEEILKAAERGANLTRQLLAFSRKQIVEPKILNLNEKLGDLTNMLSRLVGEHIEIHSHFSPELGQVRIDPSQFEQIILNLVVNARDAMPHGGRISIETRNTDLGSHDAAAVSAPIGRCVELVVSDSGVGMDAETQGHVFEPFFTTKQGGTGLGMATVYGAVKQCGGNITVYSEPGHGTAVKVLFPRVDEPATPADSVEVLPTTATGERTILLVEDSDGLRSVTREFLQLGGYRVLEVGNGADALALARECHDPIDLLLTDVVMPGMSGPELAKSLVAVHPETHSMFMSGYTEIGIVRDGILEEGVCLISKPFSRAALLKKVRELLPG